MKNLLSAESTAKESGQAIIELALGIPVFLLMVFGFVQFCLVIFGMGNANFASRAAIRYATLHSNTSYKPMTQSDLNALMAPFILHYPSNTWNASILYQNGNTNNNGMVSGNYVGDGVQINVTVTYTINVMGHTFNNLTYSTSAAGAIMQ